MGEKANVNTVELTDGRVVDFVGKRRMLKTSGVSDDGKVQVQLDFVNGETRLFTVPDSLTQKFMAHGAEQKLGDEIAGVTDIDDAIQAIDELINRLYDGEWSQKRAGGGGAGGSVLARALMEALGKTREDVTAFLKNKSHAEKMALRGNARIKPIIDRIEAEKAAKAGTTVDTDALLDDLDAGKLGGVPEAEASSE